MQLTTEEAIAARVEELTARIETLAAEVLGLKESQGRSFARFDEMVKAGSELFEKINNEGMASLLRDVMGGRRRRRKGGVDATPNLDDA